MRVQLSTTGGLAYFPKLNQPVILDSTTLSEQDSLRLRKLVADANFFDLPATIEAPKGAADHRQYRLTVEEDDGKEHTISFSDPVSNRELQALQDFLKLKGAQS
jgi:hypothetical protein